MEHSFGAAAPARAMAPGERQRRLLAALGSAARGVTGAPPLEITLPAQETGRTQRSSLLSDVAMRAVATPPPASHVAAFLDGVQSSRVVAYVGVIPVVAARAAAVVRVRAGRRLTTWDTPRVSDAIYLPLTLLPRGTADKLDEAGAAVVDTSEPGATLDDVHPQQLLRRALHLSQRRREALERDLAERWCTAGDGVLYLDGALPDSAAVLDSSRVVGVVKSHHTLYTAGEPLGVVMSLAGGERSSTFLVELSWRRPVASWYLRLRDAGGRDPLWGLVRVEVPPAMLSDVGGAGGDGAGIISSWVAAETAPLALPDSRWDTMAYGIRDCEVFLRTALGRGTP